MTWGSFCIIPCPVKRWDKDARKWSLGTLSLLGLFLGLLWYGLAVIMTLISTPLFIKAAILTVFPFLITGFMHLDGYMDCNDAILSRRSLEDKQKILKDPHVGAFAVISVVAMMIIFYGGMGAILSYGSHERVVLLIIIPVLTRTVAGIDVLRKSPMENSQYKSTFDGTLKKYIPFMAGTALLALAITMIMIHILDTMTPLLFISICIIPFVSAGFAGAHARKELGGMNGDIAGYSIVWGELMGVLALAVL